jgi:hypothetical protein
MICDDCLMDTTERWTPTECSQSIDGDHHPARCLNHNEDCSGPVDLWWSGGSHGRSWPRCTYHGEQRQESYENSMERYADSDVIPDWFDPAYAGERWFDD